MNQCTAVRTVATRQPRQEPKAYRMKCTLSTLQHMVTVGLLPDLAVLGVRNSEVVTMARDSALTTSKEAGVTGFSSLFAQALANPPPQGPSVVPVGSTERWESFAATRRLVEFTSAATKSSSRWAAPMSRRLILCITGGVWCRENVHKY